MRLSLLAFALLAPTAMADPLLIINAKAYTMDPAQPWAEAVAINAQGTLTHVGSTRDILTAFPNAVPVDLEGQMLLPGFHDVHLHAIEAGISATFCEMPRFGTEDALFDALDACAFDWEGGEFVMGAGVNMANLLNSVDDPLALIDAAIPNRPAVIIDDIGHGAWANSLALDSAGFFEFRKDPPGGILIRDDKGELTGVILESLSQTLVDAALPAKEDNLDLAYDSLLDAQKSLAAHGITSISDAGGYWPRGHDRIWAEAETNRDLTLRASNALYVYPDLDPDIQIAELKRRFTNDPNALVRFNQVKIYVDGILTQATSALLAPYAAGLDLPEDQALGFEYFPRDLLMRYARELSAVGFQLHFHTTGDRGARLALDAIEQADATAGPHRITHLYMIDKADLPRFADLSVIADLQLAPSSVDPVYQEFLTAFIGERAKQTLPLNALLNAGATVTLSSDWDADDLSPLIKLQTVLTRPGQTPPDLATTLQMMISNPAKLLKHDHLTGSITVGKQADLVVIDQNLFDLSPDKIATANILATLFEGTPIHDPMSLFD